MTTPTHADSPVVTVLFTDLAGSTAALERLGDDAARQAYSAHLSQLRAAVADCGGREVKDLGDGLMVAFASVVGAVRCAIAMQRAVAGAEGPLLRIGLDAGEPIADGDDLFGTPVVVARRLCDSAAGGQIYASDVVCRLVTGRVDAPMTSLGPLHLKGLSQPIEARLIHWREAPPVDAMAPPDDTSYRGSIRVLVVDDQRLLRAGFRAIVDDEPDMVVVGEAADGAEAVEQARRLSPDVILMDIRMPGMDGLTAARRVISQSTSRVLILTTFDADEYVYEALRAGASGFLLKDAPSDQLVGAVRSIASGNALIDPSITRRLIRRFARAVRPAGDEVPASLRELTPRELDVLRLVARGLSNEEIAERLIVGETTVKTHVGRILQKLGIRDRVQAVVLAYESGFVVPDDGEGTTAH